jgi:hypothetical protein
MSWTQNSELVSLEHPERTFFWTAPATDGGEVTTEDPLGLDYIAQQLGLELLPTLTTRSSRAQAYAMVLYGLDLAERAAQRFDHPRTEETIRQLFERWERFWAMATLEFHGGRIARGHWDAMRGIRGAKAAWREAGESLPLEFQLISRQQELGNLGAYLVPLRRAGLVVDGGVRLTPAALEVVDCFWDEPGENKHRGRYDEYGMSALEPDRKKIERKRGNLTLSKVGERSRLLSLIDCRRTLQQQRLHETLFARARDPHTQRMSELVTVATNAGIFTPRELLDAAIAGRLGEVSSELSQLLQTARAFGDFMQGLVATFDRVYATVERSGMVATSEVVRAALSLAQLSLLKERAKGLLEAPAAAAIRRLPMHGAQCLRLAADLCHSDAGTALELLLSYHAVVQRSRRRGSGWVRAEAGKLVLSVTSYTPRPESVRYPSFKLDVVRTLLIDLGRLPFIGNVGAEEVTP